MPKKAHTQLQDAVEIIKSAKLPLTKEAKKAVLTQISTKFGCSEKTAYYYYFYKAMKLLASEGVVVSEGRKAVTKKSKKPVNTAELIAALPKPTQDAMKASSPFAALGV